MLTSFFQKKTWANKLRLRRKLYSMQLKAGKGLQEHLKEFVELFSEMAVVGEAMEEEGRVICLLASLPERFSTLVTALETSESVPSWDTVTEKLLHEESKHKEKEDTGTALVSKPHRKQYFSKKSIKCFECGKIGHMKKNCRVFIEKCNKSKENANYVDTKTEENVTFIASSFSCVTDKNQCIIDSGASQHMTHNRNIFSN